MIYMVNFQFFLPLSENLSSMDRTRTLLLLLTSVIILFKLYLFKPFSVHSPSPTQAHEDHLESETELQLPSIDGETNRGKHAWPLLYENGVVPLNGKNFSDFMTKNRYVMVMFYADWCYWSKQLAPEFAATAKMLKGEAEFAMVDAYVEKVLARKYDVQGYPTMYLFVGGVRQYEFWNERKRDIISAWVRRKIDIGAYSIATMDEAERILTAESKLVLGFLDNLEGSESKELAAAAKLQSDINFYQTASADVAELFHIDRKIKRPTLIFLKTVTRETSMFHGQFTRFAIAEYISNFKLPLVVTLTVGNAELVFQNPMKQLWLFAPGYGSQEVISTFEEVAKAFKRKLLLVYIEMNSEGVGKRVCLEFGFTGNVPTVIAYSSHDGKKYVLDGELTLNSIKSFGTDFLEGKLLSQSDQISETILKLPSHSHVPYQLRSRV